MIQAKKTSTLIVTALAGLALAPQAKAQSLIYGIGGTDTGTGPNAAAYSLFSFNSATPGTINTIGPVATTTGFTLQSIAFQPTTGNLYGFQYNGTTSQGQLVTIDRTTGVVGPVGTPFTIGSIAGSAGNSAAISFNPTNGAVRLVTGTYGNYRINPVTGTLNGQDASVTYAAGDPNANNTFQVSTLAYNNTGTLYDIDYINNNLATQSLASGELNTVGFLGITATQGAASEGFTIGLGNAAFLNVTPSTAGNAVQDSLYSVNLATGTAALLGSIGSSATFNTADLAAFVPEPGAYALCGLGIASLLAPALRRRRAG